MPKAGHCATCDANVWLNPDGSCVSGHPAACISGVYDPIEQALPPAPAIAPGRLLRVIVVGIVAGLLVLGAVTFAAFSATGLGGGEDATVPALCYANQRWVESSFGVYILGPVTSDGSKLPADWEGLMQRLVPSAMDEAPTCPSGGTYSFRRVGETEIKVTCSKHGPADSRPDPDAAR